MKDITYPVFPPLEVHIGNDGVRCTDKTIKLLDELEIEHFDDFDPDTLAFLSGNINTILGTTSPEKLEELLAFDVVLNNSALYLNIHPSEGMDEIKAFFNRNEENLKSVLYADIGEFETMVLNRNDKVPYYQSLSNLCPTDYEEGIEVLFILKKLKELNTVNQEDQIGYFVYKGIEIGCTKIASSIDGTKAMLEIKSLNSSYIPFVFIDLEHKLAFTDAICDMCSPPLFVQGKRVNFDTECELLGHLLAERYPELKYLVTLDSVLELSNSTD